MRGVTLRYVQSWGAMSRPLEPSIDFMRVQADTSLQFIALFRRLKRELCISSIAARTPWEGNPPWKGPSSWALRTLFPMFVRSSLVLAFLTISNSSSGRYCRRQQADMTASIILPLYVYPFEGAWDPVFEMYDTFFTDPLSHSR